MGVLKEEDVSKLKELFGRLKNQVKVVMFTQEFECEHCKITRELLLEVEALSDKITLEVNDLLKNEDLAKQYGVDKLPAIVLLGERDYGIRFYGVPAGYEFTTLIEDIIDVSAGDPKLPPDIVEQLAKVDQPVHMQVFVSPTCPYCPKAVRTAHRFAMANEHVTGDMVEITEFPHLANKYDVQGVPKTVINEKFEVAGAQPEQEFVDKILEAIGK